MADGGEVTRKPLLGGRASWLGHALLAGSLVVGGTVAYRRVHRTDEQVELANYVERELPSLAPDEQAILDRIAQLFRPGGPRSPEEARKVLVDDVIPRLIRLRKQASSIQVSTPEARALRDEYLAWVDRLVDACRAGVRAIDDPRLPPAESLPLLRRRFADADEAQRRWREHLQAACARNRLLK